MFTKIIAGEIKPKRSLAESLIGVGATEELNLRVSIGVLAQTFYEDPDTHELMLVLERKATYKKREGKVKERLQAQPLGGASVLKKPQALLDIIDRFNYDNEKSRRIAIFDCKYFLKIRSSDFYTYGCTSLFYCFEFLRLPTYLLKRIRFQ